MWFVTPLKAASACECAVNIRSQDASKRLRRTDHESRYLESLMRFFSLMSCSSTISVCSRCVTFCVAEISRGRHETWQFSALFIWHKSTARLCTWDSHSSAITKDKSLWCCTRKKLLVIWVLWFGIGMLLRFCTWLQGSKIFSGLVRLSGFIGSGWGALPLKTKYEWKAVKQRSAQEIWRGQTLRNSTDRFSIWPEGEVDFKHKGVDGAEKPH